MVKRVILILGLVAICGTCLPAGKMRYAIPMLYAQDKIIAVVNNDVITHKDLDDFADFLRMQLSREYKGSALEIKIESIKKDLLDGGGHGPAPTEGFKGIFPGNPSGSGGAQYNRPGPGEIFFYPWTRSRGDV